MMRAVIPCMLLACSGLAAHQACSWSPGPARLQLRGAGEDLKVSLPATVTDTALCGDERLFALAFSKSRSHLRAAARGLSSSRSSARTNCCWCRQRMKPPWSSLMVLGLLYRQRAECWTS